MLARPEPKYKIPPLSTLDRQCAVNVVAAMKDAVTRPVLASENRA